MMSFWLYRMSFAFRDLVRVAMAFAAHHWQLHGLVTTAMYFLDTVLV